MEKVVHISESLKTIFYSKFWSSGKSIFDQSKFEMSLNFNFEWNWLVWEIQTPALWSGPTCQWSGPPRTVVGPTCQPRSPLSERARARAARRRHRLTAPVDLGPLPPDRRCRPPYRAPPQLSTCGGDPITGPPPIHRLPRGIKSAHRRRPWVSPMRPVPPLTALRSVLLPPSTYVPSQPPEGHHRHHVWSRHHRFLPSPVSYRLRPLSARILGASPFIPSSWWCRTSTPTVGHRSSTGNAAVHRCRSHHPTLPIVTPLRWVCHPRSYHRKRHSYAADETALAVPPRSACERGDHDGAWAECGLLLCDEEILFWIDFNSRNSYRLLKYIENTIRLRKI
jgi:hypothetical protein